MIGFGKYGKAHSQKIITSLADARLVKIDPQEEGFFDKVLNFDTTNKNIKLFIEAIEEVKSEKLEAFYKPIYDPSEGSEEIPIIYKNGNQPNVGHSYNWWVNTASKMPTIEGKKWEVATEYQWYAFLVDILNKKITSGESLVDAIEEVVNDSTALGHYYHSEGAAPVRGLEKTGSRCVCGFYDLANVYKLLKCSNQKVSGFWVAGGYYCEFGDKYPLANLDFSNEVDEDWPDGVAMLVL